MTGTWASTWATGDVVTAAEYSKSMGCVADSTLGVSAASFDFSGLPTTYAHLRIVAYLRGDTAAVDTFALLRLNNDVGANYDYQQLSVNNATVSASASTGASSAHVGIATAATAPATTFAPVVIDIPNYANATNFKVTTSQSFEETSVATAGLVLWNFAAIWRATPAAINRVTLLPAAGNFVAGSRCSIYVLGS